MQLDTDEEQEEKEEDDGKKRENKNNFDIKLCITLNHIIYHLWLIYYLHIYTKKKIKRNK